MVKVRAWTATERRTVSTPDGPMLVEKGDFVMIVIAPSWEQAAREVTKLEKGDEK